MVKSDKFKSGDIVCFYDIDDIYDPENVGIFIGRDINNRRELFINSHCLPDLNRNQIEYEKVKSFLKIEDDRIIHYFGWQGLTPYANTGINICDLDQNTVNMILSNDNEVRNLTLQMLINQNKKVKL